MNFSSLFAVHTPIWDLCFRGTCMFLFLFILVTMMNRKQAGKISNSNFLLIVIIADVSQNAFSGTYTSLSEGIVLVLTVFFWSYIINWLAFHFRFIDRLINPPPLPLIKNGQIIHDHLRKSLISRDELYAQIRIAGIDSLEQVQEANIEADGNISFITKKGQGQKKKKDMPGT